MSNNKLNINIRPFGFLDLLAFKKLIPTRKNKIKKAQATPIKTTPPVNVLAHKLHPDNQYLIVSEIIEETATTRTYKLVPDRESSTKELAMFRPGQYLSFFFVVEGASVTRPYSISSSPAEALEGFYNITVKKNETGFITNYIWDHWKVGSKVISSGPQGHFYYENLRDLPKIIGVAGGCGITPFRSIIKSIVDGTLNIDLTLFYGSNTKSEMIFSKEFEELQQASNGKVKVIKVISEENAEGQESGFITADLITKYAEPYQSSFFICGPQGMYDFIAKELTVFNLKNKFVRWEFFGEIKDIKTVPGYPADTYGKTYQLRVHMGNDSRVIPASACESVLVAMERAKLCPPSVCRSGMCGFCRSLLISGDVFIVPGEDGRRLADKQLGYIHPCSSFPVSDLEIVIPRARNN